MEQVNHDEVFLKVKQEGLWKELICGEKGLDIPFSSFAAPSYGTPTVENSVLNKYFYKKYGEYPELKTIFEDTLCEMINENAEKLYVAILYFDYYFISKRNKRNTFTIDEVKIAGLIRDSITKFSDELTKSIMFENEQVEPKPMKIIQIISENLEREEGIKLL